jgi:drug/metabolite transporter (DMT)-like permease
MSRDLLLLAVAIVAISSASILIRLTEADPVAITFWRLAIATVITTAVAEASGRGVKVGAWWPAAAAAGALLAVHFTTWIASLFYTTIAISTTLVNLHPLAMLAISKYGLSERISRRTAAGVVSSVAGSLLMFSAAANLGGANLLGAFLALIGALAFAGYLAVGRLVRARADTLSYTAVAYGFAALFALAASLGLGAKLLGYSLEVYVLFAAIAVIPMLLGHSVFNYLLGKYRAITVAVSALGEPVGATLLAVPIFGQIPQPNVVLGMALILAGVAAVSLEEVQPRNPLARASANT